MKQLWAHIAKCKDQRCQVSHCVSSRYVLSHYHRCKDARCAVCGPVREAIQRHHERASQLQTSETAQAAAPAAGTKGRGGPKGGKRKIAADPSSTTIKVPGNGAAGAQGQQNDYASLLGRTTHGSMKEGTSLVNTFPDHLIKRHIDVLTKRDARSTMQPMDIKLKFQPVIKKLIDHKYGYIFASPVDPVVLGIPDYFELIKDPMDLGTVKKRLDQNHYKTHEQLQQDVVLTFNNAIRYNDDQSPVNAVARELKKEFEEENAKVLTAIQGTERKRRAGVNACKLCGGEKLQFEPPIFYCNGTCSQRIRRNAWYHATPDNKSHWCVPCFGEIKGAEVTAGDKTVKKSEMKKLKHNEMSEESWVQCETCERWVHMICGLFNNRFNDQNTKYHCPSCVLWKRMLGDHKFAQQPAAGSAKSLKRTYMSDYLEKFLHEYLRRYQREKAVEDKCKPEDVQSAEGLTVRVCSVLKKTSEVKEQFLARYKDKGYPAEIAYVSKGMLVFQNIDGIDVIIFGMYVHEFGDDAPEPNKRRVYLSYLDSVKYMQPAHLRTKVYHAILIAYVGWIKKLGYHTCHIWACPPMKGDDYILYQKPEDQKTPKPDRLRKWYIDMLDIAKEYGYVDSLTNLVKDCFVDNSDKRPFSATVLPYFEGDYWVGVAEDHLTKIKEEKEAAEQEKNGGAKAKSKKGQKSKTQKAKGLKKGTRSSGPVPDIDDPTRRDELMIELNKVLDPMKEDFIVAKLRPVCKTCKETIATEVWCAAVEKPYCLCNECYDARQLKTKASERVVFKKTHEALGAIDDPDTKTEKSIDDFDTRQAFLQLCQLNHYQYDFLRRAKHSSMMVLYHLHNPDAPNFVSQCQRCHQDITSGIRWNCKTCDYDLCDTCRTQLAQAKGARNVHQHPLSMIRVNPTAEDREQDERARQERARSIQLHMQLLVHASACGKPDCPSANCNKMKALLKHGSTCQQRATGGCHICRRIWALLQIHARGCKVSSCPVPRCKDLKDHLRRLARQQQASEARRRAEYTRRFREQASGGGADAS